jgi:hypothetical protein
VTTVILHAPDEELAQEVSRHQIKGFEKVMQCLEDWSDSLVGQASFRKLQIQFAANARVTMDADDLAINAFHLAYGKRNHGDDQEADVKKPKVETRTC